MFSEYTRLEPMEKEENRPEKADKFQPPSWASPGPTGSYLSVLKEHECVERFSLDDRMYYMFGRLYGDILTLHDSCSGVHAALTYHKGLSRWYIFDILSTHGTFVGGSRITPEQLIPVDRNLPIRFGASSRSYFIRLEGEPEVPEYKEPKKITQVSQVIKETTNKSKKRKNDRKRRVAVSNRQNVEPEYFDHSLIPGDFTGRFEFQSNAYILESPDTHNNRQVLLKVMNQKKRNKDNYERKSKRASKTRKSAPGDGAQPPDNKLTFFKNLRF
ncbi:Nuclear inhibitor of protein phosphatase 1 [Thelohanellus kitauei]|uniref:Nuclear inhibitor of protein phosphatase 1 n=1 Tax=Thelohanellus kitauei TaxID=669202 RepID=A0A0C2N4G6_THEKT|nr:Nuclear inhibitor of protein phosphatase 1 [Thelohanellus kitauei]